MHRTFTRIALYTRILLVNDLRLFQRLSDTILVSYSIYPGKKEVLSTDKTTADYNDYNDYNDCILWPTKYAQTQL